MNTNAFQAGKFDPQVYRACNGGMRQNCAMNNSCGNGAKNCTIKACDTKTPKGCNKTRP